MDYTLKVWRQKDQNDKGKFVTYQVNDISPDVSFLEMLDILNQDLIVKGDDPIAFDHDCREGICGTCSMFINGRAHGPLQGTTTCQLHMRHFGSTTTIVIEPWRAKPFPVIKDLIVDRTPFERIMQAGGFISTNTGSAPEANNIAISKENSDKAFDAAACIGCGACVASCKNASAMLFISAKISHLALLPQGKPESAKRVQKMIGVMDKEGFGNCTNTGACEAECPKEISLSNIARLNREFITASLCAEE